MARRWLIALLVGVLLLCAAGNGLLLVSEVPDRAALGLAFLAAVASALLYVLLVLQIDRYEYEPAAILAAAFLWGAMVAFFFSAVFNTLGESAIAATVGEAAASLVGDALIAPVVEETAKGLALVLLAVFLGREFDNTTDGIVYGALVGIGFAMTENVLYFGRELLAEGVTGFAQLVYLRSFVGGWGHALFTATLGVALGWAREGRGARWLVLPIAYALAIFQHALWNFVVGTVIPTLYVLTETPEDTWVDLFVVAPTVAGLLLGPGLLALLVFAALALRREAQVVRQELRPEVEAGILSPDTLAALISPRRRQAAERRTLLRRGVRAWLAHRELHDLAIDLAFRRWHLSRGERPKGTQRALEEADYHRRMAALSDRLGNLSRPAGG